MRRGVVVVVDLVCVLVFAAVGRVSHGEDLGPSGMVTTAWPFVVGWLVGSVLVLAVPRTRSRPVSAAAGGVVWVATVVVGMVLRHLSGAGVQTSFVIVTAVVLGVFVLGWRGVAALVARTRRDARTDVRV